MRRRAALLLAAVLVPATAWAHLPLLIPTQAFADKGKPLTLRYGFGHPFERELLASPKPKALFVRLPSGDASRDLSLDLEPTASGALGTITLTPKERGDYVFAMTSQLTKVGPSLVRDTAKAVVNVGGVERGWDARVGHPVEIMPLTRPYGLTPGSSFRGVVLRDGQPYGGATVRFERFSEAAPKRADYPRGAFITRVEKANERGEFSFTLPEDGWWVVFSVAPGKTTVKDGKPIKTVHRGNFWFKVGA